MARCVSLHSLLTLCCCTAEEKRAVDDGEDEEKVDDNDDTESPVADTATAAATSSTHDADRRKLIEANAQKGRCVYTSIDVLSFIYLNQTIKIHMVIC